MRSQKNYFRVCFGYSWVFSVLFVCAFSFLGCGKSVSNNETKTVTSKNENTNKKNKDEQKKAAPKKFDLVGTWHSPPRDQKPTKSDWGPWRSVTTYKKTGEMESILTFQEPGRREGITIRGKYSVKGDILYSDSEGRDNPPFKLSYRKKHLIMTAPDGSEDVLERAK